MGTASCHSAHHEYKLKDQNILGKENTRNTINMQSNKENSIGKTQPITNSKNLKIRKPFLDITNNMIHTKKESEANVKRMKVKNILIKNSEDPDFEFKDFDSIQKATHFLSDATFLFQFFTTNLKMIETFKYSQRKDQKTSTVQTNQKNEMRENLKSLKKPKSKSFSKKSNLYLNEESLKETELDDLFMRLPSSPNKSLASTPQFQSNAIKLSKQKNKMLEDYLPKKVLCEENVDNSTRLEAYLFDSSLDSSKKDQEQMVCYDEPNLLHIPNEKKKNLFLSRNRNMANNDIYNITMEQPKMNENNFLTSSLNSEELRPRIFSVKQEAYEKFEVEEIKKKDEEEGYELEGLDESEEMYYENEKSSEIQENNENNGVTDSDQIYEKPFDYYDQERKTNCKGQYNESIEMVNTRRKFKENEEKWNFSNIESINLSQIAIQKKHPIFSEEEQENETHMININLYDLIHNRIKTKKNSESNRRYMFEQNS